MNSDLDEALVDVRALAKLLGVSERTAESIEFTQRVGVPRLRVGGLVRFRPADIREALARLASDAGAITPSVYRIRDRRQDGTSRVVATFCDLTEARAALDALRRAGDATAQLELVAAVDPLAEEVMR
jgi:hypothetical protein